MANKTNEKEKLENLAEELSDVIEEQSEDAQKERDEALRKFGHEALKNPEIAEMIQRYKEIASTVNQVGGWLNGTSQVNPDVDNETHMKWLATRYCMDTIFLMDKLGVVQIVDPNDAETSQLDNEEPLEDEEEVVIDKE